MCTNRHQRISFYFMLLLGMTPIVGFCQDAATELAIDDSAIAVVAIDLEKLDSRWLIEQLGFEEDDQNDALEAILRNSMSQLREVNANQLYVVYPPVISHEQLQLVQPYIVFPSGSPQQAETVKRIIDSNNFLFGLNPEGTSFVRNSAVISGPRGLQGRLPNHLSETRRQQLDDALQSTHAAPMSLLIVPSQAHKKVLRDITTSDQRFAGMGDVHWIRADVNKNDPTVVVRCALVGGGATDGETAKLKVLIESLAKNILGLKGIQVEMNGSQNGTIRMTIASTESQASPLSQVLKNAINSPMQSNIRRNLKILGLAMHNFHNQYSSFPPSASYSEDGQPLLSWRVHLLPFLDERQLYNDFHLDEPWDSPHNSQLIHRIPAVFRAHRLDLALAGKTTIVLPLSEDAIFSGETGTPIQEIIDGTSNTILAIDAPIERAVVWTKPDDVVINWNQIKSQISGDREGAESLLADGSARHIPASITTETLKALVTRAGREAIEPF